MKLVKDAQEGDRLSRDEVEIEAVAKNMKHYTQNIGRCCIDIMTSILVCQIALSRYEYYNLHKYNSAWPPVPYP